VYFECFHTKFQKFKLHILERTLCYYSDGPGIESRWRRSQGFFSWIPTEPCALGSAQRLKNDYQGFPGGKGGRCVRLTTYHPCSVKRQEIRDLNLPGPPWAISTPCCGRDFYLFFRGYAFDKSYFHFLLSWLPCIC